jgi:hypothetical protein
VKLEVRKCYLKRCRAPKFSTLIPPKITYSTLELVRRARHEAAISKDALDDSFHHVYLEGR